MSRSWDSAYHGTPPWDIGRPQAWLIELVRAGSIKGRVLDVGCGTGEHVLYLVADGYDALGIDGASTAIRKARAKARERGLSADFQVADALDLPVPDRPFDTVIDNGLFHVFSDEERAPFRQSLERAMRAGGSYFMVCFSDQQPGDWGPRRITEAEIRQTFRGSWIVDSIEPTMLELTEGRARAWLASIRLIAPTTPA